MHRYISNNQMFNFMEKTKLIKMRESKRIPQRQIAEQLNMDISNYNRREKGQIYIKNEEWKKLAKILDVSVDEIYESDDNQSFICGDNVCASFFGTNLGTSNFYAIPESFIETQQKYIAILEKENEELKQLLQKN